MRTIRTLLLGSTLPLALTTGTLTTGAIAQDAFGVSDAPVTLTAEVTPATNSFDAAALAGVPARGAMADRVRDFVSARAQGVKRSDLVLDQTRIGKTGRVHQRFEQVIEGRRVYGAGVYASFEADGRMTRLHERAMRMSSRAIRPARISATDALKTALVENHADAPVPALAGRTEVTTTFAEDAFFYRPPEVEEVLVGGRLGRLAVGYLVKTWSADTNELYHTLVGPTGEVMEVQDRTARDQYGVFPNSPGRSQQVIAQGPGGGNAQSPIGWLSSGAQSRFLIQGNNTATYLDTNDDNRPDAGGATVTNGSFIRAANLSDDPSSQANREVAVQNLFWLTNVIHDTLYRHGFDERARNFQEDNFGRGGAGSDSVYAEAQDGSGTNNANFATPGDGVNPRMQMYIWDRTNPRRDGDLDSDIVWHEYGHGLTWRMIGNMSGPISGAIGEGMGDVLAILQNGDDAVGEWSLNNAAGIRSERYTNYSRTIGDFGGSSVHFDGEIYAGTIWRLKSLFEQAGLTVDDLMDTLVEGMNFTAPAPDYMDMRDGILDAAPTSQDCLVWEAFAAFGMGEGSSMPVSNGRISIRESTQVPSSCTGGDTGGGTTFPQAGALYSLRNVATGGYLDTDGSQGVDQNATATRSDKYWRFDDLGGGRYRLVNAYEGRGALDTQNNGVVQWVSSTTSTRADKVWTVTAGPNGSIRLFNNQNGRGYLEGRSGSAVGYNTGTQNDAAAWVPARVN